MNSNEKKKRAFVVGITGQDGSYLAELLMEKSFEVHGLVRRSSSFNRGRIEHLHSTVPGRENLILHYGDLTDASGLARIIERINPDEIYNLGAQSHVRVSFDIPEYTANTIALGTLRLLEAIREARVKTKVYQASSSEMYGNVPAPQDESTSFSPVSPYGTAKLAAFHFAKNYRESYGIFVSNGILFNHESPRRGEAFVTRKITLGVAEILAGKREKIYLGNLDAKRDWGYAPEYVEAMWRMLQHDTPDDYVIATGETHSVREFVEEAFRIGGIRDWEKYIAVDKAYWRPSEVNVLCGNSSKAKKELGWEPRVRFRELVKIMLTADCDRMGVKFQSK